MEGGESSPPFNSWEPRDCGILAVRVTWEEGRVRKGQGRMGRGGRSLYRQDRSEGLYQGGALAVEGLRHTGCLCHLGGGQGEVVARRQRSGV